MRARVALLALLTALSPAQEPASDYTFKADTNLVVVNVTVRDKQGKPVLGLRKDDFQLTENGKPQTISVFEFQQLSLEPASGSPPPEESSAATAVAGSQRYRDKRLIVLFFDFAGMSIPDQLRAQDAAVTFIREKLTAPDLVSIMSFSSGIRTDQEFTNDREKLLEAIRRFRIGEGFMPSLDAAIGPDGSEADPAADAPPEAEEIEFDLFNTDRKLGALEHAVRTVAALPEKKAFVYFSSGAGGSGAENQAQLRSTINAAVRANVSFYPVDVRGLMAIPPGGAAAESGAKGTAVFTGKAQRSHRDKLAQQQETLSALAVETGGRAMLDSNDLTTGMVQAQRDIQSYYTIGYYSSNDARDGRFRRIALKIESQPQARLDFRSGYFGDKDWKAFTAADKERQLQEALLLGDPVTDLPVALEVNWFRLNPTKFFIPVSVKVPASYVPSDGKPAAFDFIGQVRDLKGRIAASVRDEVKLKLPEGAAPQDLKRRSVLYDTGFTLPPGAYRVKFLVREQGSGRMGTFETSFDIPGQPAISSVVWSSQRQPVGAALASVEKNRKLLAHHPLIRDGQKLVPSVTRLFRTGQKLYVYVESYDAQSEPAAAVSLFRGRTKVMESQPIASQGADGNRAGTTLLQFQIPLDGVRPGRYIAQLSVVDPAGRRFAYERTALVVAR